MGGKYSAVRLGEVLTQNRKYIDAPEPIIYQKLSVKLYGKGVVLDEPVNGLNLKMRRHQIAESGQVILSEIWGKKGAIGFVPPEGAGALCTSHFFLFDVNEDRILRGYLEAIFKGNYLEPQLGEEARGTTGYAAVRPKHLLAAQIPLPPLHEQRRIVARIEALAGKVEAARKLREVVAEEAKQLFLSISIKSFSKWGSTAQPIGKVITFRNDLIRPNDGSSGEIRFVGLQHIESHTGRKLGEDFLHAEELTGRKFQFSPGEIIYGYLRPYLNKVWIADCDGVCSVDQYVICRKPNTVDTSYLAHFMRSRMFLEQANELTHNLMLPRLRTALLQSILLPLPPLSEQRRIVAYLDALQDKLSAVQQHQAATQVRLDALLPSILDKAFRGAL